MSATKSVNKNSSDTEGSDVEGGSRAKRFASSGLNSMKSVGKGGLTLLGEFKVGQLLCLEVF